MLKQFLPFLIFILFFSAANAQVNKASSHYHAGIELKNNNKFPEAIAEFNKAITLNKYFDSAYFELGNLYLQPSSVDYSIIYYKNTITCNPKFAAAWQAMGKVYRDFKMNLDSALYFYDAALKLDSTNKELLYSMAWVYNARKEHEQAIPFAVKALEIDNSYRPAYGELGHAFRATKHYKEAIEQFKKNLAVSVVDVAYLYSGYCYTELNDKAGAMEQYEALLKVNEKMAAGLKKKIDTMQ